MANLDLSKYGITDVKEVLHNPSYDVLFAEETKPGLEGFEKGQVTELGAVNVMTGVYTGRSPKDKFFVKNEASENSVWWTSDEYKNDNKPCTEEAWADLKAKAVKQLSGKRLFVVDTFCGANAATRMKVRFIMEVAWQAHFVTNMFIRPTAEELEAYGEPDFVCFNASKAKVDNYKELGLNSETATVFNLKTKEQVILNTWYGGEMKKGMFSIMNYMNPLRGIASMHCSANTDKEGKSSAIFFGLSGTFRLFFLFLLRIFCLMFLRMFCAFRCFFILCNIYYWQLIRLFLLCFCPLFCSSVCILFLIVFDIYRFICCPGCLLCCILFCHTICRFDGSILFYTHCRFVHSFLCLVRRFVRSFLSIFRHRFILSFLSVFRLRFRIIRLCLPDCLLLICYGFLLLRYAADRILLLFPFIHTNCSCNNNHQHNSRGCYNINFPFHKNTLTLSSINIHNLLID